MAAVDRSEAYAGKAVSGGRLNADRALGDPAQGKVRVKAAAFNEFAANEYHTGTLTIETEPDIVPTDDPVTWQATLLTAMDGKVYGLVGHAVDIGNDPRSTDASAQVPLGPAEGVRAATSKLTHGGVLVTFGTRLPPGEYAVVVDLVAASDRRFAYGPSAAVFFTVPEADQQPGTKDDPASQAPAGTSSPDATSPNATIPDATTPNATAPDATSPDATSPESTRQGEATPGATVPGGTAPGSDLSGYSIPGGGGPAASGPGSGSSGATTSPATGSGDGPTDGGPTGGTGSSEPVVSPRPGNPPVTHDGITIISVTPVDSVGHTVIIIGDNLPQNATVSIDGLPTYVIAQRISTITVTIPNGITSTAPDVTIADRTGGNVTMPDAFTYHPPSPQPEATAPASPAPGTDAPGGDQGTVPTSPANNDTAGQTTLTGPTGTVYRPGPTLGAGTVRAGVTLAPITANNPLAGIAVSSWGRHRCVHVVCHAIAL